MAIKARGEVIDVTDQVALTVQYKDQFGNFVNADSFPKISIVQPSGLTLLVPTSSGIYQLGIGKYQYIFNVPINGPYGIFNDIWIAYISGFRIEQQFEFVVLHTQVPQINFDGYEALGDEPGFRYSQTATHNLNFLIKILKSRLNSSGKAKSKDKFGNIEYQDCDIFSINELVTFLASALLDFNQVPFFTRFTFDDTAFVKQFGEILIEGATLNALAAKALIERGREFQITDNGLGFTPPTVSEMMSSQYNTLLSHYWEKLKMIKASLRPAPLGLGVYNANSSYLNSLLRQSYFRREGSLF